MSLASFFAAAGIGRCSSCVGLTLDEDLVGGRCAACRPDAAAEVIARCHEARTYLQVAADYIERARRS
jgi:hypothetical protein